MIIEVPGGYVNAADLVWLSKLEQFMASKHSKPHDPSNGPPVEMVQIDGFSYRLRHGERADTVSTHVLRRLYPDNPVDDRKIWSQTKLFRGDVVQLHSLMLDAWKAAYP